MPISSRLLAPFFLLGALTGCVHATPIVPVAIAEEEAPRLKAALLGTCSVTALRKEGGEKRDDPGGLSWTFGADGSAGYVAFGIPATFTYKLEGRNVLMSGPYKAFRVDDWSTPTLELFVYDLTETWWCTKN